MEDALIRIGKLDPLCINPVIPSEKTRFYRNKLEYTFSNKRWLTREEIDKNETISDADALGFHIPGKFDKVLDIKHCFLQPEPSNSIRLAVKRYALEHNLSFFDLRRQEGFLRNLIIRTTSTNEIMVILSFFYEDEPVRSKLLTYLMNGFPRISSLMYVINPKANDTINDLEVNCFIGNPFIAEKMEGLEFRIGAKSFFQTNTDQAITMYKKILEFAELKGKETVYDLYTGTGTIANFIAHKTKKVIGIENIAEAVRDAQTNAEINNIRNTTFYSGEMRNVLNETLFKKEGRPEVMIIDPPRAGMHKDVIPKILEAAPDRIVYVSCNPATQARDAALLSGEYQITVVQPFDMFPHTPHIENVLVLRKKGD